METLFQRSLTMGPAPIEVKYEDISFQGMGFKINGSYYHHVGP